MSGPTMPLAVNLIAAMIPALMYFYLSWVDKKGYIGLWASGWAFYGAGLAISIAALTGYQSPAGYLLLALVFGNHLSALISGLLFLFLLRFP